MSQATTRLLRRAAKNSFTSGLREQVTGSIWRRIIASGGDNHQRNLRPARISSVCSPRPGTQPGSLGRRPSYKKAVVKLAEGDHIELYEVG